MQTGYDNYWMYQNSRPGPLHNLQNNNHYSNAVFTDNNSHVQNGRPVNHYNDRMQPPNNVAYYHQNSQYRASDFHQTPSSMYLEPFRPSNVNNTQPRRDPVNWPNRSGYLPQNSYTHENFSTRCSENYNKFSQVNSSAEKNNIRVSPDGGSNHPISRIRVKDVYSINNNNVGDSFSYKGYVQPHSKRQRGIVINYGSNNYCGVEFHPQTKLIDNTYLKQPRPPPPYYRHAAPVQPQKSQFGSSRPNWVVSKSNTSGFVPQEIHSDKYNPDNMLPRACANEKAAENTNSRQLDSVQTYNQVTHGIFNTSNSSQIQNCCQNELQNTAYLEHLSSVYGTFGNSDSSDVNKIPNCHEKLSKSDSANLASFNSPKTPRTNLNSQVISNPETSSHHPSQEGTLIKISIPHTGQSSFIRLNDSDCKNNDSNLSLPCLLESNIENAVTTDRPSKNKIKVNERKNPSMLQTTTSEKTINNPPASVESYQNTGSPHLNNSSLYRRVSPKESFNNVNKETMNNLVSNSVPQKDSTSTKVTNPEKNIELNLLNIKQEKSLTNSESLPEEDHSISGNDELDRITKEKIPVEETLENNSEHFSGNLNTSEKSSPALEETRSFIEVKTFPKIPKDLEKLDSESLKNSISKVQRLKKRVRQHISYKSKINRDKLDMLIQFLRKDDEPVQSSSETPEETTSENNKCKDREKHRLRKLNKTCIVRNKNISREMVSLVSPKTSRVDLSKSLSEISHPVKSNMDSQKGNEVKEESTESGENVKNENCTPSSEQQPQKEDSLQLQRNIKNEFVSGEGQEPDSKYLTEEKDKEMINMMRILRTMTTNFCMNCKFSSSVDSFWVNVVSFELRCLKCFEKFLPKEFSTKNCGYETGKQEVSSENESNLKDIENSKSFSECLNSNSKENQQEKLVEDSSKGRRESFEKSKKSIKEGNMTDGKQNSEENVSMGVTKKKNPSFPNSIREKSERKSSSSEESADKVSSRKSILKDQPADNKSRTLENECKNEKLRTPSKKMEDKEDVSKKEKKGNADPKRKSSTESTPNETPVPDESAKNEGKRLIDSKERSTEPKISKQGKPEMSEIPTKSIEFSSSNESKPKPCSNDSERKKSLKRKHSNDDLSPRKVFIPNAHSTERKAVVTNPTDKTKTTTSKDVKQKISNSSTNKSKTKGIVSQKIKSPGQTHDSIKRTRKRTQRDEMKQYKDKNRRKEENAL